MSTYDTKIFLDKLKFSWGKFFRGHWDYQSVKGVYVLSDAGAYVAAWRAIIHAIVFFLWP